MRREFFGPDGDTTPNLDRLLQETERFEHHGLDVRDRGRRRSPLAEVRPDLVVHCAAQPSHDLAAKRPFDDFDVNAVGTLNLLEAARASCPESPFVFLSTNKVYGDAPNELELVELETRYDYADPALREESTRAAGSTRRCTACSARRRPRRTSSSRSTAGTSGCRRSASAAAASPARTTPAPSCTASSPTSRGACSRAARIGSMATRASRSATTSMRRTSARRPSRSPRPASGRGLQHRRRARQLGLDSRGDRAAGGADRPHARRRVRGRGEAGRPHLLHQRPLRLRGDYPGWDVRVSLDEIFGELCARRDEPDPRHGRGGLHRLAPGRAAARGRSSVTVLDNLTTGLRENVPARRLRRRRRGRPGARRRRSFADGGFDAVFHIAGQASIRLSFAEPEVDLGPTSSEP